MIRDVLVSVAGIEIFPILSLLLFLAVFVGVLIRVTRLEDTFVERMGALPLDDSRPNDTNMGDSKRD